MSYISPIQSTSSIFYWVSSPTRSIHSAFDAISTYSSSFQRLANPLEGLSSLNRKWSRLESLAMSLDEYETLRLMQASKSWFEVESWQFIIALQEQAGDAAQGWSAEKWLRFTRRVAAAEPDGKIAEYCRFMDRLDWLEDDIWFEFRKLLRKLDTDGVDPMKQLRKARLRLMADSLGLDSESRQLFKRFMSLAKRLKQP